jgi:hypothetical protein
MESLVKDILQHIADKSALVMLHQESHRLSLAFFDALTVVQSY